MFRTAKTSAQSPLLQPGATTANPDVLGACLWESWTADLATGVIRVGDIARECFDLAGNLCGFINIVRPSEPEDQLRILTLFEEVTVISSSFCYSTIIRSVAGKRQPVFCIGESTVAVDAASGTLAGVFGFPRLILEGAVKGIGVTRG